MLQEFKFCSRDELFDALLKDVMENLSSSLSRNATSLSRNERASMLLSGGTSPAPLYERMSRQEIDWSKIYFGLTDERWVDADHPESNEKLAQDVLLKYNAASAHFVGLKSAPQNIAEGHSAVEENLKKLPFPFDITLLGMGTDGHMASLFPNTDGLKTALDLENKNLCQPVIRGEGEIDRMTMTLSALLSSKEIKLLIFGKEKWQVYQKAKASKSLQMPVSYLLHQTETPVSVYWSE